MTAPDTEERHPAELSTQTFFSLERIKSQVSHAICCQKALPRVKHLEMKIEWKGVKRESEQGQS